MTNGGGSGEESGVLGPARAPLSECQIRCGVLVRLLDDLDIAVVGSVSSALEEIVRRRPAVVILDVGGCFVDVAGVRALVSASDLATELGGCVMVAGLPNVWDRALPALGLAGRLARHADVDAATADYQRRSGQR